MHVSCSAILFVGLVPLSSHCSADLAVGAVLPAPPFESYPVSVAFRGKPAPVDLASAKLARRYRTVLRDGARSGPNFADHFTVVSWGCGTLCQAHAIVDARTGRVYMPIVTGYGLEFRRDSRLLVADPADRCLDPSLVGPDESVWYTWTGKDLRRVASLRIAAPCETAPLPDCSGAEQRSYQMKSWPEVHRYFKQHDGYCIDGALGEGVSERVTRLLDERWQTFAQFQRLASTDVAFAEWVAERFWGYAEDDCAIVRAVQNLQSHCPRGGRDLCDLLAHRGLKVFEPDLYPSHEFPVLISQCKEAHLVQEQLHKQ